MLENQINMTTDIEQVIILIVSAVRGSDMCVLIWSQNLHECPAFPAKLDCPTRMLHLPYNVNSQPG